MAAFNQLYLGYKRTAGLRGCKFQLSKKLFRQLTSSNCHYCGIKPAAVNRRSDWRGLYRYNGLDRKRNTNNYSKRNCVPCCKHCNYAKRQQSTKQFIKWLDSAADFRLALRK